MRCSYASAAVSVETTSLYLYTSIALGSVMRVFHASLASKKTTLKRNRSGGFRWAPSSTAVSEDAASFNTDEEEDEELAEEADELVDEEAEEEDDVDIDEDEDEDKVANVLVAAHAAVAAPLEGITISGMRAGMEINLKLSMSKQRKLGL